MPYAVLLLVPRIAGIDRRLEEAAHDLGASGAADVPPRRAAADHAGPPVGVPDRFVVSIDEVAIASFLTGDNVTYPMFLYSA